MGLIDEVLDKQQMSVLAIPGHPADLFTQALPLLRPADVGRLVVVIRVVQELFGRRHFVLN